VYVTAWRFLNTLLDDEEINAFFIRETQRSLRKVFFEPATSTPEVSIDFGMGGRIDFADQEKLCQFTLNFCLPLYSDDSARVTLEFLDLFYVRAQECLMKFYNEEREAGRMPRIKLYGMSPGIVNVHSESEFCVVSIVLALAMFEDIAV
jgi:hypothetical protein